jgi:hypothetical protein
MNLIKFVFYAFLAFFMILSGCNSDKNSLQTFGEAVDTIKAIPASELANSMGDQASLNTTISGKVVNVCKAEGCWIKLDLGEDEPLMVRMFDHSFTVTENVEGKFAFVVGQAHYDTLTVEKLQDYAKDEGASPEEIAAITKPELELVFEAKGVAVR